MIDFKKYEAKGLIKIRKHPDQDLYIANYTPRVQFDKLWNDVLILCRGLIYDGSGTIIARPFPKFFNLEEHKLTDLPNEPFEVYDKLDGSLGILYWNKFGQPAIATRGSFDSPQAKEANKILWEKYFHLFSGLNQSYTYLFEIIYPENRIVVNYGLVRDLYLLEIIDTKTGENYGLDRNIGFKTVNHYHNGTTQKHLLELANQNSENQEGYVVKFKSGFRIKIKFAEYKRLHKIFSGISTTAIWENLKEGKGVKEMLEIAPDEWHTWIKRIAEEKEKERVQIGNEATTDYLFIMDKLGEDFERKDFASLATAKNNPHLLFALLDDKDIDPMIWRGIKPTFERPVLDEAF